jgi:hypothetical protein
MLTEREIVKRVNAWIEARAEAGWFHQLPLNRLVLFGAWKRLAEIGAIESGAGTGVIIGLAREAHGEPSIHTAPMRSPDGYRWIVTWWGAPGSISEGDTEIEAALFALERTPR